MTALSDTDTSTTPPEEELSRMSLVEHLEEFRSRIVRSLIAMAIASFSAGWSSSSLRTFWPSRSMRPSPKARG